MGLLRGAPTVRRFLATAEVPDNFRTAYADLLQARAFQPAPKVSLSQVYGWARADNILEVDFVGAIDRWLFNQYAVFVLRIEQRKIPPRLFRAELARRVAAWCEEHKRERAPASVRTEIKELLQDELAAKCLPLVRTHEVVWNVAEGWVALDTAALAVGDIFRKLFRETFGIPLVEAGPLEWLRDAPDAIDALKRTGSTCFTDPVAAEAATFDDGPRGQITLADLASPHGEGMTNADLGEVGTMPHLTADFLLWLWWRSERDSARLELAGGEFIDVWVDDRVATRKYDGGGRVARVGDDASRGSSCVGTLLDGHVVNELRVGLRRQGREYKATIKPGLILAGCKLPTECKGGDDEVLYERGFLLEDLWYALGQLYRLFAAERTAAEHWAHEVVPAMARWLMAVHRAGLEDDDRPARAAAGDDDGDEAANRDLPDGPIALYHEGTGAPELVARATVKRGRVLVTEYAVRAPAPAAPASTPTPPADPFRELLDLTEQLVDHAEQERRPGPQLEARRIATEATRWRDICRGTRDVPPSVLASMTRWRKSLDGWRAPPP